MEIQRWEFPLAKAEYLLNYTTMGGQDGDKRKFWHEILGFQSPETLRMVLLQQVTPEQVEADGQNAYGTLYRLVIRLAAPTGRVYRVRTIWIIHFDEKIAPFVTAYPEERKG